MMTQCGVARSDPGVGDDAGGDQQLRLLIREFVGIHNVVTNLMRATNYPGYYVYFVALGF